MEMMIKKQNELLEREN